MSNSDEFASKSVTKPIPVFINWTKSTYFHSPLYLSLSSTYHGLPLNYKCCSLQVKRVLENYVISQLGCKRRSFSVWSAFRLSSFHPMIPHHSDFLYALSQTRPRVRDKNWREQFKKANLRHQQQRRLSQARSDCRSLALDSLDWAEVYWLTQIAVVRFEIWGRESSASSSMMRNSETHRRKSNCILRSTFHS